MAGDDIKPRAREGLLASDHSKRGKRIVSILDPSTKNVTLLEPWEHAVLILCDGTRDAVVIAKMLEKGVEGDTVELKGVQRTFKYFEREKLVEVSGKKPQSLPPAGPRTLAEIQLAYREWHKDPVRTGQILSGLLPPPVIEPPSDLRSGLDPTVALPEDDAEHKGSVAIGSMLVLAGSESLLSKPAPVEPKAKKPAERETREPETLIGPLASEQDIKAAGAAALMSGAALVEAGAFEDKEEDIAALLASVDEDVREFESREAAAQKAKQSPPPPARAFGGEAIPPMTRELKRPAKNVAIDPDPALVKKVSEAEKRAQEKLDRPQTYRSIPLSEAALRPTMVGIPSSDVKPNAPPVLLATPKRSPSVHDELTARLIAVVEPDASLSIGAVVQDVAQIEATTEGMISPMNIDDTARDVQVDTVTPARAKRRSRQSMRGVMVEEQETMELDASRAQGNSDALSPRAREVFELLRRAGLRARHHHEDSDVERTDKAARDRTTSERPKRRRDESNARLFDTALHSLSAGELEVALAHFRKLKEKLPQSKRLSAFIEAIEAVRTGGDNFAPDNESTAEIVEDMLDNFEAALEEAVAYGRCPACFSMVAKKFNKCFACGFQLVPTA